MTEPVAPAATEAPAAPPAETAATPSVAGGAELGAGVKGRPAAIEKARAAMEERDSGARDQALKQAEEHAAKTRAKTERDSQERGEDGKFKPALSPADATKQAKPGEPKKPEASAEEDDAKLDGEWRKVRSAKKAARDERKAAQEWREEQARSKAEAEADSRLKKENPAKWLEKHEFDFREVAKQSVAKVEETTAEKAARLALEKADRLEKQLQERDARDAEVRQQQALAAVQREHAAAWAESGADYPTLSAHYEASEIIETLTELRVEEYKRSRREVPISAALSHMEKLAKQEQARFTRKTEAKAPAKPERTERATVAPKGAKTRAVVGPVTNRDAAIIATPPTGLSPEERRARSTQLAAQGWRR